MKRPVEYKDLLKFHFLAAPTFSPDGGRIAYKVSRANAGSNRYDTDLWLFDIASGANRRLTSSGREECFCWSADGRSLLFASGRPAPAEPAEKEGSSLTRFYSISTDGGEAELLFQVPHRVTDIRSLGQDRCLLTANFDPEYANPEEADFMIFEQVPFMANGKGYIGQRRVGLGVFDIPSGKFTRLLPETVDVSHVELNGERTRALVVGCDYKDVKPVCNSVWEVDLASGACSLLTGTLPFTFKCAVWAGEDILVTATDHKARGVNEDPKIWLLENGELTCMTPDLETTFGHPVVGDTSYGCRDHDGTISPSALGLVCCAAEPFKSRLCCLGSNGRLKVLTPSVSSVIDYDVHGGQLAYAAYEGLHLTELYLYDKGQERRLTSFNDAFFDECVLSQPIHITFKASDGWELDGWYMRPHSLPEGQRCPTILNIHGGPKAAFGDVYHHEMQCWAARGFGVIYCNPRGGNGRGGEFSDIRGHYGDVDYKNLMDFTDWCVKNLSFVDASHLGVTGGSYGGYMTNWIITQTNRFRAAVSQRSIANWVSKFGGCDIGYYYVEDQHLGTPWRNPETAWHESPVAHADRASTPTLFIHSTEDFRCELNQGFQMFTALKVNGVKSRMCVFRGENHELSRAGKPRNRLARLREILQWFEENL